MLRASVFGKQIRSLVANGAAVRNAAQTRAVATSSPMRSIEIADHAEAEHSNHSDMFNATSDTDRDTRRREGRRLAPSLNRVELLGGVADDVVVRQSRTGGSIATFGLFTNIEFRQRDGAIGTETELHHVIVFGGNAHYVANNISKGTRVFVSGRLRYNNPPPGSMGVRTASIVAEVVQPIAKAQPRRRDGDSFNKPEEEEL